MRRVVSGKSMREADRYTIDVLGVSEEELIRRAGESVADEIAKRFDKSARILFLTGKGNNGKDGTVCADALKNKGYENIEKYSIFQPLNGNIGGEYDVIVECLLGTGIKGEPKGEYKTVIESANAKRAYKIAVDIPGGLNADNGKVTGVCFVADLTIAIGELKTGYFLNDGKDYTGEIVVKDVGISVRGDFYNIYDEKDVIEKIPVRRENSNKGSYGKVIIVGGSKPYVGGSFLTYNSLSAIKSGAGYTAILVPESLYPVYSARVPEAVTFTGEDDGSNFITDYEAMDKALKFADVICYGNGIGISEGVYENLKYILENSVKKVVIDADGINVLVQYGKEILKNKKCEVVLTPHVKEFSRLSGKSVEEVTDDSIGLAKAFAEEYGVVILLKSNTTVITDGESVVLNVTGNSGLAKAGSGDVLSGLVSGLSARMSLFDAGVCGAYIFGRSADIAVERGSKTTLMPGEVISVFSDFFKKCEKNKGKSDYFS